MAARFEYKYLVSNSLLELLRKELSPYMELDEFAKRHKTGEYTVRSIYYDSPTFTCYKEKLSGLQIRNKYRIRGYDNQSKESVTFLEIKHKNTNCISKCRAPIYYTNVAKSLHSRRADNYVLSFSGNGEEKKSAQKFLYYYYLKNLRPAVLVIYDREAFFGKFDPSLRLTFDKKLRSIIYPDLNQLYNEESAKPAMVNNFIFEIKFFGTLPAWVRSLISRFNLERRALSKYTITLDSHKEFTNPLYARMNMIGNHREACNA